MKLLKKLTPFIAGFLMIAGASLITQESEAQCCTTWQEYSCPGGGVGCGDGDGYSCSYHKNCKSEKI